MTFQKMFKNKGLDIIISCNMKTVNYLDVTLNLKDGSYRPNKKPNDETNYIHVNYINFLQIVCEIIDLER